MGIQNVQNRSPSMTIESPLTLVDDHGYRGHTHVWPRISAHKRLLADLQWFFDKVAFEQGVWSRTWHTPHKISERNWQTKLDNPITLNLAPWFCIAPFWVCSILEYTNRVLGGLTHSCNWSVGPVIYKTLRPDSVSLRIESAASWSSSNPSVSRNSSNNLTSSFKTLHPWETLSPWTIISNSWINSLPKSRYGPLPSTQPVGIKFASEDESREASCRILFKFCWFVFRFQ